MSDDDMHGAGGGCTFGCGFEVRTTRDSRLATLQPSSGGVITALWRQATATWDHTAVYVQMD